MKSKILILIVVLIITFVSIPTIYRFVKEAKGPSFEKIPEVFVGPGGCKSEKECEAYCQANPRECEIWCQQNPEACEKYRKVERHEEVFTITDVEQCKRYWHECKELCAKPENLETCSAWCEENPVLCELLPEGVMPSPVPRPNITVTYFKGTYVILAAQSNITATLQKAKQIGSNAVNLLVDFKLNEKGNISLHVDEYKIAKAINLAHEQGMQVQLSGGFITTKIENFSNYFEGFEDYENKYASAIVELAKTAQEYNVERFEVLREIDVAISGILTEFEGWPGWWVCWEKPVFINSLQDFSDVLLMETKKYYSGRIGIGFAEAKDNIKLPSYEFVGISIYNGDEPFKFAQTALAEINDTRKYINDIEELVLGETSIGGLAEGIALSSEQRKQIYNEFFEATHDKIDGYFVFIDEPYPDSELEVVAKEWYGRLPS